ncbi:hypothetical protein Adt_03652 [Abeliophyllum distichum]|uniref:Uncharacterized protein n=1 Tax=Abeliophyllum distichum TaxID=126358 RepID=A0ABD1VZ63_9LAMI
MANRNFEAMVAKRDKQLVKAKEDVERVKVDRADAEARAVMVYHEEFESMSEYMELAHKFMMTDGHQLVERIGETHPEWDISFLRYPPDDLPASEDPATAKIFSTVDSQDTGEAQTILSTIGERLHCADP